MLDYGSFLKLERERRGMVQEDLAKGICSVKTISRIENGRQIPSVELFCELTERLGVSGYSYSDFSSAPSVRLMQLERQMLEDFNTGRLEDIPQLLEEYRLDLGDNRRSQQFYAFMRASYFLMMGDDAERFLDACYEAILVTQPDMMRGDDVSERLLMQGEYRIFNASAVIMTVKQQLKQGTILLNQLIVNQKRRLDVLPTHWANLAVFYNNASICEKDIYPNEALKHIGLAEQAAIRAGDLLLTLRIARTRHVWFGDLKEEKDNRLGGMLLKYFYKMVNDVLKVYQSYWDFLKEPCFLQVV